MTATGKFSEEQRASARKFHSTILQRLAGVQAEVAEALEVDESTISRMKEGFERVSLMLVRLGLKIVPAEKVCVDKGEITYLRTVYDKVRRQTPWVLDEDSE